MASWGIQLPFPLPFESGGRIDVRSCRAGETLRSSKTNTKAVQMTELPTGDPLGEATKGTPKERSSSARWMWNAFLHLYQTSCRACLVYLYLEGTSASFISHSPSIIHNTSRGHLNFITRTDKDPIHDAVHFTHDARKKFQGLFQQKYRIIILEQNFRWQQEWQSLQYLYLRRWRSRNACVVYLFTFPIIRRWWNHKGRMRSHYCVAFEGKRSSSGGRTRFLTQSANNAIWVAQEKACWDLQIHQNKESSQSRRKDRNYITQVDGRELCL
jgi:hypothetical protein